MSFSYQDMTSLISAGCGATVVHYAFLEQNAWW